MKIITCGAFAASLAVSAFADVAFSTFGPGDSFTSTGGYIVGGSQNLLLGTQFKAEASGMLTSIEYATTTQTGGSFIMALREDVADEAGPFITQFIFSAPPAGNPPGIVKLNNNFTFVTLTAGKKYWLEAHGIGDGVDSLWHFTNQAKLGRLSSEGDAFSKTYFDNQILPAFRVNVVPEPTSMAVLGLGALTLVRKRRKKA